MPCYSSWLKEVLLAILGTFMAQAISAHYFDADNIIYQEKSLYRNIFVTEGNGYRCMDFGKFHATQTCIQLANPRLVFHFTQSMFTGLYINPAPKRVLILGLGGGVIPMALRALDTSMVIDTVELDPAVVRVAKAYFGYKEDPLSRTYVDDARVFIRKLSQKSNLGYDLIILDAFDKHYIPEHLLTQEFLSQIKSLLNINGVVVANTHAWENLVPYETATYQAVFGSIIEVNTDEGNRLLLARRETLPSFKTMQNNAIKLDPQLWHLGITSADLLPRMRLQAKVTGVRILTDQFSPSNLLSLQTKE